MKDDSPTAHNRRLRLSYPNTVICFRAVFEDAVLLTAIYEGKPGGKSRALAKIIGEYCDDVREEMRKTEMGRRQLSLLGQLE